MKSILVIILVFNIFIVNAQNAILSGRVSDSENTPIDFFNALLFTVNDTTFITGNVFSDGYFQFQSLEIQKYLLKISSIGFEDYWQTVTLERDGLTELPPIVFQTQVLDEIIVTARRPTILTKADKTIVNVEGSILSHAINGLDMLQKTPGLIVDGRGGIRVAGIGSPIFYIDGRQVRSSEEIQMMNPQNIRSIEIITNPSAAYDAEGQAVVRINTIKRTDQYSLRIGGDYTQSRRGSGRLFTESVLSVGKLTTTLQYTYSKNNGKTFEDNYSELPTGTMEYHANSLSTSENHSYRVSTDWMLSERHSVQLQSDGFFSTGQNKRKQLTEFSEDSSNNFNTHSDQNSQSKQINGTINYNFKIDTLGQTFSVVADYTYRKRNTYQTFYNVIVGNEESTPFLNQNDNSPLSEIYSIKSDYHKPFNKMLTLDAGIKFYNIKSDNRIDLSGSTNIKQHNKTDERNFSAYTSMFANINDKLVFRLGLRGENTIRNAENNGINYFNSSKFYLFPNTMVNYRYSDDLTGGLSYSARISRPSMSDLDPSLILDSLLNRKGNPDLKSTLVHSIQLSFKFFNSLSLRGGYSHIIHPIYFLSYKDETNPQMTNIRIENGDNTRSFFGTLSFDKEFMKWWSFSLFGSVATNYYPYFDENNLSRNNNKPFYSLGIWNTFNLPWGISLDTGLNYSRGSDGSIIHGANSNFYASLQKSFLNRALLCTLSVNDIFGKSITHQQSVLRGRNLNVYDGDNQYVKLSISYKIGKSAYRYSSKSSIQEERRRIQ